MPEKTPEIPRSLGSIVRPDDRGGVRFTPPRYGIGLADHPIQAQLRVGASDDPHEREADQIADHVLGMPGSAGAGEGPRPTPLTTSTIQREPGFDSRAAADVTGPLDDLRSSGGRPLSAQTREFFEPRFGADFSHVRVHDDPRADKAASGLGARAFTSGRDVVFGSGEYQPDTPAGRRLLAHELTHVIQQRTSSNGSELIQRDLSPRTRADIATVATAVVLPMAWPLILALRVLGFQVTGLAIGLRGSGTVVAGVGASAGADALLMFDVTSLKPTGDVLPYAELGLGAKAGVSGGVIIGLRISPTGKYENMSDSYSGPGIGGSIQALAGIGLSVGTSLLQGQEGWVTANLMAGATAGAALSLSYAVTSEAIVQSLGAAIVPQIQKLAQGLVGTMSTVSTIGKSINSTIAGAFGQVLAIFDPKQWNLTGYEPDEKEALLKFGNHMAALIRTTSLDAFLAQEGKGKTVASRLPANDIGLAFRVANALNGRYRRRYTQLGAASVANVFEPDYFLKHTYLQFLGMALDNGFFSVVQPQPKK